MCTLTSKASEQDKQVPNKIDAISAPKTKKDNQSFTEYILVDQSLAHTIRATLAALVAYVLAARMMQLSTRLLLGEMPAQTRH